MHVWRTHLRIAFQDVLLHAILVLFAAAGAVGEHPPCPEDLARPGMVDLRHAARRLPARPRSARPQLPARLAILVRRRLLPRCEEEIPALTEALALLYSCIKPIN